LSGDEKRGVFILPDEEKNLFAKLFAGPYYQAVAC
jgi:hypothetical protein